MNDFRGSNLTGPLKHQGVKIGCNLKKWEFIDMDKRIDRQT